MRTIGMDHARQKRTQPRGFRVTALEKVLIVLGIFLFVGSALGRYANIVQPRDPNDPRQLLGSLFLAALPIGPALLSIGVRYVLYRRARASGRGRPEQGA